MFKITEGDFKNQTYGEKVICLIGQCFIFENGKAEKSNHVMSQHQFCTQGYFR